MELRHLRYFATVARELNFRRAAEQLHVTRPALSRQIQDLETELGARLLERNTVKVSLTEAGRVFLKEAQDILKRAERAATLAREAALGRRGKLAIGSAGPLAPSFLPAALREFREACPEAEISLVELPPPEQPAALLAGEIQIGFSFDEKLVEARPELERLRVLRSRVGAAMAHTHPLAGRKVLELTDIAGETLLCVGHGQNNGHAEFVLKIFTAANLPPPRIQRAPGFDSLMAMIAGEQGVSFLPKALGALRPREIIVTPFKETGRVFTLELWAVWRAGDTSPLVRNFIHILKSRRLASATPAKPPTLKALPKAG